VRPILERVAGAPTSWGLCEVPGWGIQLPPERVLPEMSSLGIVATEAGPDGYLGDDASAIGALLARHGLQLIGGFLPVVLHDPAAREATLTAARQTAARFEALGASFLVSALVVDFDWSTPRPLSRDEWKRVYDGFLRLDELAHNHGLTHVLHPHWGTLAERRDEVWRTLEESEVLFCLDTGHLALGETDPVEFAEAAGSRIAHAHLKDASDEIAGRLRSGAIGLVPAVQEGLFRPLGDGDAPVAGTVRTLERAGYDGWYVLEQDVSLSSGDQAAAEALTENVRRSIDFLRALQDESA
jgi:inosose dehydratase